MIDICDPAHHDAKASFFEFLKTLPLLSPKDRLLENYVKIPAIFDKFLAFTICYYERSIIGFSGLYSIWGPGIFRALTRTYYHPSIRTSSLKEQFVPNLATKIMLPYQVEVAKKQSAKVIFVSMENPKRKFYFEKIFKIVNTTWEQGEWVLQPGFFNVCPTLKNGELNDAPSCWQSIVTLRSPGLYEQPPLPRRAVLAPDSLRQ